MQLDATAASEVATEEPDHPSGLPPLPTNLAQMAVNQEHIEQQMSNLLQSELSGESLLNAEEIDIQEIVQEILKTIRPDDDRDSFNHSSSC